MLDDPAQATSRFMQLELKPGVEFTPPAAARRAESPRCAPKLRAARSASPGSPDCREAVFEGLHHLNTSNQADPTRVARLLLDLWSEKEKETETS